jgi:hypothetical protein
MLMSDLKLQGQLSVHQPPVQLWHPRVPLSTRVLDKGDVTDTGALELSALCEIGQTNYPFCSASPVDSATMRELQQELSGELG